MSTPSSRPRTPAPHSRPSSPNPLSLSIADARRLRASDDADYDFAMSMRQSLRPSQSLPYQPQRGALRDRSLLPSLSKSRSTSTPHADGRSSAGDLKYLRAALAEAKALLHQQAAELEVLRSAPAVEVPSTGEMKAQAAKPSAKPLEDAGTGGMKAQAAELAAKTVDDASTAEMKAQLLAQAAELEQLRPLVIETRSLRSELTRLRTSDVQPSNTSSIRQKVQAAGVIQWAFRTQKARRRFKQLLDTQALDTPPGIVDDVHNVLINASRRKTLRSAFQPKTQLKRHLKRLGTLALMNLEYSHAQPGVVVFGTLHVVMSAHVPPVSGEAVRVSYQAESGSPQLVPGGKGLNQAVALAKLGVPTHLVSRTGKDSFSLIIQEYLQVLTHAYPNLMTEGVRMVKGARTGVGLLITGEEKCATNIVCHGATKMVGEEELHLLKGILASHAPGLLLLGTELPMDANMRAARLAKEKGMYVVLRLGSMRKESVHDVKSLLLDGNIDLLFASAGEASLLGEDGVGDSSQPMTTALELRSACATLLGEFCNLRHVVLNNHNMYIAGERHESMTGRFGQEQHWSDETGCYYILPQHHLDYQRKEHGRKANGAGVRAAFLSGYVAAIVQRLSIGQGLLWGYAAMSMCSTVDLAQLPGHMSDSRALLSVQIGDALALGAERELDDGERGESPFAAPRYLMQNEIHFAVLSAAPSRLPVPGEGGLSLEGLGELVIQKDVFGFTPVQRAHALWARTRGDPDSAALRERTLLRRLVEWALGLFMLLSAVDLSTTRYNLLLAHDSLPPDTGSKPVEPAHGTERAQQSDDAPAVVNAWKEMAIQSKSLRDIFKQSAISNLVNTIEGDSWQGRIENADDATCLLATAYVMGVLEEAGRKRKARLDVMGNSKLRHLDANADNGLEAEQRAATRAELTLVVSSCVPLLHKCLLEVSSIATQTGNRPPRCSHPFANSLVQCREPQYGRSLLLLAAGAGPEVAPLVEVLVSLGAPKLGYVNLYARSTLGRTALHEAGEAENIPVFKMLLERTNLVAMGAAAADLTGVEPLHERSLAFRAEMERRIRDGSFPAFLCGGDAVRASSGAWQALTESLARELDVGATRLSTSSHLPIHVSKPPVHKRLSPDEPLDHSDSDPSEACIRLILASDVFIVFLAPGLVHKPQGLFELATAYDACKKMVGVLLDGLDEGVYEETEAKRVLDDFDRNLWETVSKPSLNPLAGAGRKCWNLLESLGSSDLLVRWRVGDSADEVASQIEEQMRSAVPPEVAIREYKSRLMIKQFVQRKMSRKRLQKRLATKELQAKARHQLRVRDRIQVRVPQLEPGNYHLFLSHHWRHGQDAMRVVKQRVLELSKNFKVFLDVDDLKEGFGGSDIPKSSCILFFFTEGFFSSKNCARELITAYALSKPMQALLEPDASKGAVPLAELATRITSMLSMLDAWGLALEFKKTGITVPTAKQLKDALLAVEAVEWNRLGPFQDVTMRRISERCLPSSELPTCVEGELAFKQLKLKACTSHEWHLYVSPHNVGAAALIDELSRELKSKKSRASDDQVSAPASSAG